MTSSTSAATLVVAQITITTFATAAQQQAEQDFNASLPGLVTAKGPRVALANMAGVQLSSDGTHPNDAGYQDMANRWETALANAGWLPA